MIINRTGAKVCSDGCAFIQEDGQKVSSIVASTPTTLEILALGSKCKMNTFVVGHGGAGDNAGGGSGEANISKYNTSCVLLKNVKSKTILDVFETGRVSWATWNVSTSWLGRTVTV